jgi:hypothetical protein
LSPSTPSTSTSQDDIPYHPPTSRQMDLQRHTSSTRQLPSTTPPGTPTRTRTNSRRSLSTSSPITTRDSLPTSFSTPSDSDHGSSSIPVLSPRFQRVQHSDVRKYFKKSTPFPTPSPSGPISSPLSYIVVLSSFYYKGKTLRGIHFIPNNDPRCQPALSFLCAMRCDFAFTASTNVARTIFGDFHAQPICEESALVDASRPVLHTSS